MQKIDKKVQLVIEKVEQMCGKSSDLSTRTIQMGSKNVAYLYLESVSSDDKISNFLGKSLSYDVKNKPYGIFDHIFSCLKNTIPNGKLKLTDQYEELFYYLASGFTAIVVDGSDQAIVVETRMRLDRGVTEATTENVLRGPKDAFTENNAINIGLIRKRIKDPNLWFHEVLVGRRTKTKVNVVFIKDIVDDEKVQRVIECLEKIDVDGILDSGYIREFLDRKQVSSFPKIQSSERPDLACESLLNGKIVVMVENTPYVLIMPALMIDYFHNPEDYYQKPNNVSLTRIIRFVAFFITILTPGFYIGLMNYNPEVIPDKLLISLAVQRQGVPFPTAFEVLLLQSVFEILRESDIRLPKVMGTSISIVGALVLGDAAVSAGIVSPIVVIVVAFTSICSLIFTDIDFINAIRNWRLAFAVASIMLGLTGFAIIGILFVIKLCSLESLGVPYTTPFSPFYPEEEKDAIIRMKRPKLRKRPEYLARKNINRMGGE